MERRPLETLSQGSERLTTQVGDTTSTSSLAQQKQSLRERLRKQRKSIPAGLARHAASAAALRLLRSGCLHHARHVALYLAHGSELATAPLLELLHALGIRSYVPKIGADHSMRFLELRTGTRLRRNRHGIAEPVGRRPVRGVRRMDLIILPLLGFDDSGRRLGTGGGYYDRALAAPRSFRKPLRVGYGYEIQRVTAVPAESWDIRLDAAVTESSIYRF